MSAERPIVWGLTGQMASGKSTVATLFQQYGFTIWDADDAVHYLYGYPAPHHQAITDKLQDTLPETIIPTAVQASIQALFPGIPLLCDITDITVHTPKLNRSALMAALLATPEKLPAVQGVLYPTLFQLATQFIQIYQTPATHHPTTAGLLIVAPLLHAAGLHQLCQQVYYCHCPADQRRTRALQRPGMNAEKYALLNQHQPTDAQLAAWCTGAIPTHHNAPTTATVAQLCRTHTNYTNFGAVAG